MGSNKTLVPNKRPGEALFPPTKRSKPNSSDQDVIQAKNWAIACEQVSGREYFDYRSRFLLVCLPSCMTTICEHEKNVGNIKQIPTYAEESFLTEIRNRMWYDALEVCHMSLTQTRYLSCNVLQEIVEIILNVHDDKWSEYTAKYIVKNCQQMLLQNFSMHPPCLNKNLRKCYVHFLTSSMPAKDKTFTNRKDYEHSKGIVKYCLNRLECELSADSKDGPIVDKFVPEELKDTVRGFHWQKQSFEIFETLNRQERIERLFAVLETVIEVMQFDLAIQHSKSTNDESRNNSFCGHKLMEYVLWSESDTAIVSKTCLQIMRIFANIVHLQYPNAMVKIVTTWLNNMIQTFYTRETKANCDYPNISKYCIVFANEFYDIIADMPHDSIVKILERIEPTYMRHIVGLFYLNRILSTDEGCIMRILGNFLREARWKLYPTDKVDTKLLQKLFDQPTMVIDKINFLLDQCVLTPSKDRKHFLKKEPIKKINEEKANLGHIVHTLYITLDAFLDATKLQSVKDTWNALNGNFLNESLLYKYNCYSVSEEFKNRYERNMKDIKKLADLFNDINDKGQLPQIFNVFSNISLLDLHIWLD